jgi:hypothetical protein
MDTTLHALPLVEAERYMGHLGQLARIDRLAFEDGPQRGSRLLRLTTGGGLTLDVHPDRALDIGQVELFGKPLAWLSPTQIAHPAFYDPRKDRFLKTFGGGFLVTCGLDHFGPPCEEDGQKFGQHGRVNAVAAQLNHTSCGPEGLLVEGIVRQASALQQHLELRRSIHAPLGQSSFTVTDVVTNLADRDQPHMILYHCNFGWPLMSEKAQLEISAAQTAPSTPEALKDPYQTFTAPQSGYQERVYLHTLKPGRARVRLNNPEHDLQMNMEFDTKTLPGLCQWKMLGERNYVLGLEPTNTLSLAGRVEARKAQKLKVLAPGESVQYQITFNLGRAEATGG